MTRIVTRQPAEVVGHGPYTMKMTLEEMQYLAALLNYTRLGQGSPYREAAYNLMGNVADLFGDDFFEEASDDVNMHITRCDDEGNTIDTFAAEFCTIEV